MAQAGYTPIALYNSTTAAAVPTNTNLVNGELAINITDGKLYYKDNLNAVQLLASKAGASGDVVGPASATDNAIPTFDGTTGKLIKNNSGVTISSNTITASGGFSTAANLTFTGTGNRITGDFTNATFANRIMFQSSTTNGNTNLGLITNGTATGTSIAFYNDSTADTTNYSRGVISYGTSLAIQAQAGGTGTYLPMTFFTGGSERMRIDTSGNVGIGTTTPATILNAYNATSAIVSVDGDAATQFRASRYSTDATAGNFTVRKSRGTLASPAAVSSGDTVGNFIASAYGGSNFRNIGQILVGVDTYTSDTNISGFMIFNTNGGSTTVSERMRITAAGNVGIGTSSPVAKLQSAGAAATATPTGGSATGSGLYINNTDTAFGMMFGIGGGGDGWIQQQRSDSTNTQYNLLLQPIGGNVGIGTSSPGYRLTVGNGGADTRSVFNPNNAFAIGVSNGASFAGWIGGSGATDTMVFSSSGGTERMRIDSSGNVGIGTSSPAYRLHTLGSNSVGALIQSTGTLATISFQGSGSSTNFSVRCGTDGEAFVAYTSNNERMRIDSSGNVSVGGTAARGTTAGSAALQLFNGTAPVGTLTNGVSLYSSSGDLRFMDSSGNAYQVGFRNIPQSGTDKTGSYTLATTDVGEFVGVGSGGSITIPTSTFATGDVVSIFNNTTGNITITCSAPTTYVAGVNTARTSLTLATRGVATVLFISATVCVVTGNVS